MTAVTHPEHTTSVMLIGPDMTVLDAVKRLLTLDRGITITATASSVAEAPLETTSPDLTIVDVPNGTKRADRTIVDAIRSRAGNTTVALLDMLKDLSVSEFLNVVKALSMNDIAAYPRHLRAVPVSDARDMRQILSDREIEVVRLVAEGLSNKEISKCLGLSDKTVKNHISHILAKLNLSARTQVAVHALRAGIV